MPQLNWIQTAEFETAVRERLQQRFAEANVTGMPYTMAGNLVAIARENRPILESRTADPERPMSDALASVDEIARVAIEQARSATRGVVTVEDVSAAIQLRFCRIVPFCR